MIGCWLGTHFAFLVLLLVGLVAVFIGSVREDLPALLGFAALLQLGSIFAGRSLTTQLGINHLKFVGWLLASSVVVVVWGLALWIS